MEEEDDNELGTTDWHQKGKDCNCSLFPLQGEQEGRIAESEKQTQKPCVQFGHWWEEESRWYLRLGLWEENPGGCLSPQQPESRRGKVWMEDELAGGILGSG